MELKKVIHHCILPRALPSNEPLIILFSSRLGQEHVAPAIHEGADGVGIRRHEKTHVLFSTRCLRGQDEEKKVTGALETTDKADVPCAIGCNFNSLFDQTCRLPFRCYIRVPKLPTVDSNTYLKLMIM